MEGKRGRPNAWRERREGRMRETKCTLENETLERREHQNRGGRTGGEPSAFLLPFLLLPFPLFFSFSFFLPSFLPSSSSFFFFSFPFFSSFFFFLFFFFSSSMQVSPAANKNAMYIGKGRQCKSGKRSSWKASSKGVQAKKNVCVQWGRRQVQA